MKKLLFLLPVAAITLYSCQKENNSISTQKVTTQTSITERGLGLDLDVTIDVDNTATEVMEILDEIFQPSNLAVKIGNYGGGTDTATTRRAILSAIASHLGITLDDINDMTGLEVIDALFPDISDDQVDILTSGNSMIVCVADDANNTVEIYVGDIGAADILTNPDFVLSFDLI